MVPAPPPLHLAGVAAQRRPGVPDAQVAAGRLGGPAQRREAVEHPPRVVQHLGPDWRQGDLASRAVQDPSPEDALQGAELSG